MNNNYIYPISSETLSLVEDVLNHIRIYEGNPFVSILFRDLERECSPYSNNDIQQKLKDALSEVHGIEE